MNRKSAPPVCNKDCEHCPYPDCINDTLDYEDYVASARIEEEIIFPKTAKQNRIAAQHKAYREANREKLAAQNKSYYEANREKIKAYQKAYRETNPERIKAHYKAYYEANRENFAAQHKAYYEANREKIEAHHKAYYEANRGKLAAQQKIKNYRQSIGLSQRDFAAPLGVTPTCVGRWENGKVPANWPLMQSVYPDLRPE